MHSVEYRTTQEHKFNELERLDHIKTRSLLVTGLHNTHSRACIEYTTKGDMVNTVILI